MTSAWRGGRVVDVESAWPADDRGALLGDGLFETILVVDGAAPLLDRHIARLSTSATALRIPHPHALGSTVAAALLELHEREGRPRRGALRITLTRGRGRGLTPRPVASGWVLTFDALPDAAPGLPATPVSAVVVEAPRIDPRDPLAGHKTLSRMSSVHARMTATDRGADVALLATIDGDVAEADAANLFVVVDGVAVTPPLDRGVLPGITRARCIDASAGAGSPIVQRTVSRSDVARAEEAFVTSSLDGVRPLREIDGRPLVAPGPIALRLARALDPRAEELDPPSDKGAHNV